MFLGLIFTIIDIFGFDLKKYGFFYSIYCAVILINFTYSPLKLNNISEIKKSYKFKLNLFRVVCFLEYIPMVVLIVKSTGIYSVLPFEKTVSTICAIILTLGLFLIYLALSEEDAKQTLENEVD